MLAYRAETLVRSYMVYQEPIHSQQEGLSHHLCNLLRVIEIGLGKDAVCQQIGTHECHRSALPLVGGTLPRGQSNVMVTHLGDNGSRQICAVKLTKPIPAQLLYPISGMLRPPCSSSHGAPKELAIENYEALYHQGANISAFSMESEYGHFHIACALRYLHIISELDGNNLKPLLEVFRTNKNRLEQVSEQGLAAALGLKTADDIVMAHSIGLNPGELLSKCVISMNLRTTVPGGYFVKVVINDGYFLPRLPAGHEIYVPIADTQLNNLVSHFNQQSIDQFPSSLLNTNKNNADQLRKRADLRYPVDDAAFKVRPGANTFTYNTKNMLDAFVLAKFIAQVVSPIVAELTGDQVVAVKQ